MVALEILNALVAVLVGGKGGEDDSVTVINVI